MYKNIRNVVFAYFLQHYLKYTIGFEQNKNKFEIGQYMD